MFRKWKIFIHKFREVTKMNKQSKQLFASFEEMFPDA